MKFVSREEQDEMLSQFARFDERMIHERYEKTVEKWTVG